MILEKKHLAEELVYPLPDAFLIGSFSLVFLISLGSSFSLQLDWNKSRACSGDVLNPIQDLRINACSIIGAIDRYLGPLQLSHHFCHSLLHQIKRLKDHDASPLSSSRQLLDQKQQSRQQLLILPTRNDCIGQPIRSVSNSGQWK